LGEIVFVSFEGSGRQLIVIEVIGNRYHVYNGPVIKGAPKRLVITVELSDVNNDGLIDAIVSVVGQDGATVLINTGEDFKWSL
jgi:hypothetical protein